MVIYYREGQQLRLQQRETSPPRRGRREAEEEEQGRGTGERCEGLSANMKGVGEHLVGNTQQVGDTGLERGINRKGGSGCSLQSL